MKVNQQRAGQRPLSRGTVQVVPREDPVLNQEPLGDHQIRALFQFFSSSFTAAAVTRSDSSSSETTVTLPGL